mmetsp:Transcript_41468/g.115245  ORF Transcript_41468/g.115245 Transcript_41468/m.115245 type:complete len:231 (-) Transcript_41468:257-949(-)
MRTNWPRDLSAPTCICCTTRLPPWRTRLRSRAASNASGTICACRGCPPGSQIDLRMTGRPVKVSGSSSRMSTSRRETATAAKWGHSSRMGATNGASSGRMPTVGTPHLPLVARRRRPAASSSRPAPRSARQTPWSPDARTARKPQACTKVMSPTPSSLPPPMKRMIPDNKLGMPSAESRGSSTSIDRAMAKSGGDLCTRSRSTTRSSDAASPDESKDKSMASSLRRIPRA